VSGKQSLNHFADIKFPLSAIHYSISLNFGSRSFINSYKIGLLIALAMVPLISYYTHNTALAISTPFAFLDPFTGSMNANESGTQATVNSSPEIEICFDDKDNNGNGEVDETCSSESIMEVLRDMMPCTPGVDENCGLPNTTGPIGSDQSGGNSLPPPEPEPEICNDREDNNGNGKVDENCKSTGTTSPSDDMMPCTPGVDENCGLPNTTGPIGSDSVQSGGNSLPQPEPEPEICNDKEDNNGNGKVDENCENVSDTNVDNKNSPQKEDKATDKVDTPIDKDKVDIPTNSKDKSDKFGIREIYPTKVGGEEWFMNSNPEDDPRFSPQTQLTPNSDGSFKVKSTKIRMGVFTSSGYHPSDITTLDHSEIAAKGYMQSPNDWRDIEMTGYVKVNSGSGDNFAWYARGGKHTGFGNPEGCEGVAYKGGLYYNGETRWAKEQWHSGGYVFSEHLKSMGALNGKWVGFKTIMYNIQEGGKTAVKLEMWLDKDNNNQWVKVNERVDNGGWGNNGGECGGEPDQIITWGGPIATFRWDSASDVDIKNFSVREIQPNI
jgi:hypothetical protein